nr:unnamed protein product [Digitaria exilis]
MQSEPPVPAAERRSREAQRRGTRGWGKWRPMGKQQAAEARAPRRRAAASLLRVSRRRSARAERSAARVAAEGGGLV